MCIACGFFSCYTHTHTQPANEIMLAPATKRRRGHGKPSEIIQRVVCVCVCERAVYCMHTSGGHYVVLKGCGEVLVA